MKTLKNEIKKLAESQKGLRNQRKTVHIQGERVMESWKATYLHSSNRHQLRLLYATYAILKGKTLEQFDAENPTKKDGKQSILNYRNEIEKLVEKYGKVEVVCVD